MEQLPNIPAHARTALAVLHAARHDAWIVGGFVRDSIRGVEAHDVDIATSAPWKRTKDAFTSAGFAVHETGTKHGTVTAVVDGHPIEITTYRQEGAYSDARHPDSVTFVKDVQTDLARRDFTMNAIAYRPDKGFEDPFGGRKDIQERTIRCVGNPSRRFSEDALRIMRAARFCSQLGFGIHPDTHSAMIQNAESLSRVACERIQDELKRFLLGRHVKDALPEVAPIILTVVPQLECLLVTPTDPKDPLPQAIRSLSKAVAYAPQDEAARYAALFLGSARFGPGDSAPLEPRLVGTALRRLRVKKSIAEEASLLAELCQQPLKAEKSAVHALAIRAHGRMDTLKKAFFLLEALERACNADESRLEGIRSCLKALEQLVEENAPFSVKELAVSGSDLIRSGMAPGPYVGEALEKLLWACVQGETENSFDSLVSHLGFLDFGK